MVVRIDDRLADRDAAGAMLIGGLPPGFWRLIEARGRRGRGDEPTLPVGHQDLEVIGERLAILVELGSDERVERRPDPRGDARLRRRALIGRIDPVLHDLAQAKRLQRVDLPRQQIADGLGLQRREAMQAFADVVAERGLRDPGGDERDGGKRERRHREQRQHQLDTQGPVTPAPDAPHHARPSLVVTARRFIEVGLLAIPTM